MDNYLENKCHFWYFKTAGIYIYIFLNLRTWIYREITSTNDAGITPFFFNYSVTPLCTFLFWNTPYDIKLQLQVKIKIKKKQQQNTKTDEILLTFKHCNKGQTVIMLISNLKKINTV